MRVDRAYKGISEGTVVLFDDGMCDGPDLKLGEQYLMYTRRLSNGEVPSRGCTRSRHVKYADEDLKYLNELPEAPPTATLSGRVVIRTDDFYGDDRSVAGALIEVNGPMGRYTTSSDADGNYSIAGLEPAKYTVSASLPGFRMLGFERDRRPPSTTLEARGCAVVNLALRKSWRGAIAGRVIRSSGAPGPAGMDLTLVRLENRDGMRQSNPLFGSGVRTDENGEYSFDEVAPGQYKIVMNLYRFPTARAPYPTIYWPAARSEAEAVPIEITDAAGQQRYNFRLPPEPKSTVVNGIVLSADGKPVPGARVYIDALPDNGITGDNENLPETDANGSFAFTALEGFEYSLSATAGGDRPMHSAALRFSLAKGPQPITLVLTGEGRFPNDPAERIRDPRNQQ